MEVMKVGILKVLRLAVKFRKLWSLDINEKRLVSVNLKGCCHSQRAGCLKGG